MLHHPNARTCWPKVRLDQAEMQTVFVIETDLALLPDDPAYDHEAFSTFVEAIRAYLADHPSYDRAEVIPIRGWGEGHPLTVTRRSLRGTLEGLAPGLEPIVIAPAW